MIKDLHGTSITYRNSRGGAFHNPHRPAIEEKIKLVYYLNGIQQNIVGPQRIIHLDGTKQFKINGRCL